MTRHRNRARSVSAAALTGATLIALLPSLAPAATAVPGSAGALAATSTVATDLPTGLLDSDSILGRMVTLQVAQLTRS